MCNDIKMYNVKNVNLCKRIIVKKEKKLGSLNDRWDQNG